ncbi:DUF4846 domain-containing protein [Terrimonas alba]|uniref:DUF4846 domain-containing protein n=1 Tax=Terrimonas alba TaxID=3349636 RepID=UPI0035F42577
MGQALLFFFAFIVTGCKGNVSVWNNQQSNFIAASPFPATINDILPPENFKRVTAPRDSFGAWLRDIALKKDRHVYLYNGALKRNQQAQFAVLDKPVGKKDLQQCADAVMRLRAEYLFSCKRYEEIIFRDNNNTAYRWKGDSDVNGFERYLQTVFGMCGTASLQKQLKPVSDPHDIYPGDVFIKGGFPGHAMIVVDVAANGEGEKIFMLAQSYMPAQDIHIVKNPLDSKLSPWYRINGQTKVVTPEWTFDLSQLYRF